MSDLRFQIEDLRRQSEILNLQSEIFLAEATGVEPAHDERGDLANRCHTVRRRLLR
jgi:hypothetical protein